MYTHTMTRRSAIVESQLVNASEYVNSKAAMELGSLSVACTFWNGWESRRNESHLVFTCVSSPFAGLDHRSKALEGTS